MTILLILLLSQTTAGVRNYIRGYLQSGRISINADFIYSRGLAVNFVITENYARLEDSLLADIIQASDSSEILFRDPIDVTGYIRGDSADLIYSVIDTGVIGYLDAPLGRCATVTVAANDSRAINKLQADFVCDGDSDEVQLQMACDTASALKGKVFLYEGTFEISDTVHLSDYTFIQGMGHGTQLKAMDDDSCIFHASAKKCITIKDMYFNCNSKEADAIYIGGASCSTIVLDGLLIEGSTVSDVVVVRDTWHAIIQNCIFKNNTYNSLRTVKNTNMIIRNNYWTDGTGSKCWLALCCTRNAVVTGNVWENATSYSTARGVLWIGEFYADAYNIVITNNTFYNIDGTDAITPIGDGGNGYSLDNLVIANNSLYDIAADGITSPNMDSNTDSVRHVVIKDNIFSKCGGWGINIDTVGADANGVMEDLYIEGNLFFDCSSGDVNICGTGVTYYNPNYYHKETRKDTLKVDFIEVADSGLVTITDDATITGDINLDGDCFPDSFFLPIAATVKNGVTDFANCFVDTTGTDSLIIMVGSTRRGIPIE